MAAIPTPPAAGPLVSFDILAATAPISPEVQVQAIDIWTTAGKPARARITIRSGDPQGAATTGDEHAFLPGTRIELRVGYDNQNSPLFDGEVIAQHLETRETQGAIVFIELAGKEASPTLPLKASTPSLRLEYGNSIHHCTLHVEAEPPATHWSGTHGAISFQGTAIASTGITVELANLGPTFDGEYLVSATHHKIQEGNWQTEATLVKGSAG